MRKQELVNLLQNSAQIVRQYNLGDDKYFYDKFSNTDKTQLEAAWKFGLRKIQNKEIIKDASHLSIDETQRANEKLVNFDDVIPELFHYLNSPFDVKKLKLSDENTERRLRRILAEKYVALTSKEVWELSKKEKTSIKAKAVTFIGKFKAAFIIVGIVGAFATPRIIDGLTLPENLLNKYLHDKYSSIKTSVINVDALTNYLYENSKYKFNGAICNDGWTSHSQGRGTCSHHGGVDYYFYVGDYSKTIEQCRENAITEINELRKRALEKSWRD